MFRAYLIEMTVFRDYARQYLLTGIFVAFAVSVGMQSIVAAAGIMTCMFLLMGSMAAGAYDEQNGWGLFRLTMPLSRRDVVLGRYGVIVTLGLIGLAAGWVAIAVLTALATAGVLPLGLSEMLSYRPEDILAALFSSVTCLAFGSFVASITTPVYFHFGQTRGAQYIPLATALLFIVAIVAVNSGVLDTIDATTLGALIAFIESPAGVASCCGIAIVASAAMLAVSAAISLKLYERREL